MKTKFFLILILLGSLSLKAQKSEYMVPADVAAKMLNEADDFIDSMAEGSQDRESDAIYHALMGQSSELMQLRDKKSEQEKLEKNINFKDIITDRNVKIRIYEAGSSDMETTLIYLHGGGWVTGNIDSGINFCNSLAENGVSVVAVEYSLAPEKSFPSGLNDCINAIEYISLNAKDLNLPEGNFCLAGDDAGGNLAMASAIYFNTTEEYKDLIKKIILYYPLLYPTISKDASLKHSYTRGYGLDRRLFEAYNAAYSYKNSGDTVSKTAYPGEFDFDSIKSFPPVLMILPERDLTTVQNLNLSNQLKNLNPSDETVIFRGAIHGFLTDNAQKTAFQKAIELTLQFIK